MTTEERRRRRFSEEFRKDQVRLIESGQATLSQISSLYQVKPSSVKLWMKRFGKKPIAEQIIISNGKEFDRIRELERENKKLLEFIGRQRVELVYQDEVIKLAKEKLGKDFEKK